VNKRYSHHQRARAEAARPTHDPSSLARHTNHSKSKSALILGDDSDENLDETLKEDKGQSSGPKKEGGGGGSAEGEEELPSNIDDWIGEVSTFTDDSVDMFLKLHPEAGIQVGVRGSKCVGV